MTPLDKFLDEVNWNPVNPPSVTNELPYATHEGVLNILGVELRCYRLNDGRAIINADDMNAFFDSGR